MKLYIVEFPNSIDFLKMEDLLVFNNAYCIFALGDCLEPGIRNYEDNL